MKRILLLLWIIFLQTFGFGQEVANWSLEAKWRSGFLIAHRGVMGHLAQDHAHGVELIASKRLAGNKLWHTVYGNPDLNFHLYYGGVSNKAILGNYGAAFLSIDYPLYQNKHFRLVAKFGTGLSFSNKFYDVEDNPKNVAMAAKLFALMNVGLNARYTFHKNTIGLGVDIMHFSNGGIKLPNLGLNLPYLSVSYGRSLSTQVKREPTAPHSHPTRKIFYGITGIGSVKQVYPTGTKRYGVYALNLHARTILKPKMGWELAFDIVSKQSIQGYRPDIDKTQWRMLQVGLYAGYILPMDKFHYMMGFGYYLKDYYKADEPIYIKIGGRYYFDSGLHAQIALKTHYGKADYFEFGIGYSFNYKKK